MNKLPACGIAADTKVETPEGAVAIRAATGKGVPVLTSNPHGALLFRMMRNVRKVAEQRAVLKVTLDNGMSFRVAPDQVLFTPGMEPIQASALLAGTALRSAFHYPAGYEYRTDTGERVVSPGAYRVVRIEDGGTADVYTLDVNETGSLFLTAGILCKAEGEYRA